MKKDFLIKKYKQLAAQNGEEYAIEYIKVTCEIMMEDPELSQEIKNGIQKILDSFIQDLNKNIN
jgi:hypothetical protein